MKEGGPRVGHVLRHDRDAQHVDVGNCSHRRAKRSTSATRDGRVPPVPESSQKTAL